MTNSAPGAWKKVPAERIKVRKLTTQEAEKLIGNRQPIGTLATCAHLGDPTGEQFPPAEGLGNYVADALTAMGITQERYIALKAKWTKEEKPKCGCNWREKAINWVGSKLGLAKGQEPELRKLIQLDPEEMPPTPVATCAKHGQCVPALYVTDQAREVVVASGYTPCVGCADRELSE